MGGCLQSDSLAPPLGGALPFGGGMLGGQCVTRVRLERHWYRLMAMHLPSGRGTFWVMNSARSVCALSWQYMDMGPLALEGMGPVTEPHISTIGHLSTV